MSLERETRTASQIADTRNAKVLVEALDGAGVPVLGYAGIVMGKVQRFGQFPGSIHHDSDTTWSTVAKNKLNNETLEWRGSMK